MRTYLAIEQGSRGATYQNGMNTWTVYEHGMYPRSSVLAGQHRRVWMDDFESLEEAKDAYPEAEVSGDTYEPPYLEHLPEDGDFEMDWHVDESY